MKRSIDLNADLGEGGPHDGGLMALVSSCNIACGGHAGDETSMRRAIRQANAKNVTIGAHPSYPDREGFGRRALDLSDSALTDSLSQQVEALKAAAREEGASLTHLKPHGALYNQAAQDPSLAAQIARLTHDHLPGAALVGPPQSALTDAARAQGLKFISEGFADRAYTASGALAPRDQPGAVLKRDQARVDQALMIAERQKVRTIDGALIDLPVQTLCLHGDTPGALHSAEYIRAALIKAGFEICAPT